MKSKLILIFILLVSKIYAVVDLEDKIQDFVLTTKKIDIPGYPHALNPSIIRWKGDLLLSFRIIPDLKKKYNSEIGVVWLNDNFEVCSEPQILTLKPHDASPDVPSRAEDARLVEVNGSLYMVYDDNCHEKITRGGFRVHVAKLDVKNRVVARFVEPITSFEGERQDLREKSWVPFSYQNELLLSYSLTPHRVLRYLPGQRACETFSETLPLVNWKWGILRGGTPALKVDNRYLSFFHSSMNMSTVHSKGKETLHYFMGAYTFSSEPPFEMTGISPEPIVGKNFYHGEEYVPFWHPVQVVFPVGLLVENEIITVLYGRQDHEIWVVEFDKKGLLDSLIPVDSILK